MINNYNFCENFSLINTLNYTKTILFIKLEMMKIMILCTYG